MTGRLRRAAVIPALALLAACQNADRVLPAPPPVVDVSMVEHAFRYEGRIPSGQVVFRVRNDGKVIHRFSLVPLPDDFPPLDEQLKGDERRSTTTVARTSPLRRGEQANIAVELAAGQRYGVVCFIVDRNQVPHGRLGMNFEFRAGGFGSAGSP